MTLRVIDRNGIKRTYPNGDRLNEKPRVYKEKEKSRKD